MIHSILGTGGITMFEGCTVTSCVRTIDGDKTPSSFLIERTCRYAKNNECNLGHRKHKTIHTITKTITLIPSSEPMLYKAI